MKLTSPGPALHRHRVLGRDGREFEALKLRTMIADADSFWERHPDLFREFRRSFKLQNDPRVTPLGRWLRKTSLDELPQLLNVVRGEMSLVGPRMITRAELEKYGQHADLLLSVPPGLTGLWQVSGRQDVDYTRRVELDVEYIQRWSLGLDLQIILRTVPTVLRARGAHCRADTRTPHHRAEK
ncbi:MAG: sugar transferase [Chloroflexi bacterium]|nr:sugar transferase [Chloroflexota bacterium]